MPQTPRPDHRNGEGVGIGLAVVDALAARWEACPVPGGGTEVRMEFAHTRTALPGLKRGLAAETMPRPEASPEMAAAGEVLLEVTPPPLLAGILGRVAGSVAAEANFSIDRYSDLYLVTDGIAAHARDHASSSQVIALLSAGEQRIDLTVFPFREGSLSDFQPTGRNAPPLLLARLVDDLTPSPATSPRTPAGRAHRPPAGRRERRLTAFRGAGC